MGLLDFLNPMKAQRRELQYFVDGLAGMDAKELGHVLCLATNMRNRFAPELRDALISEPEKIKARLPLLPFEIAKRIRALQAKGQKVDACAGMVWLHTLRSCDEPELRFLGKQMWRHLRRGLPHVAEAEAFYVFELGLLSLKAENADQIPVGLDPDA